MNWQKIFIFTAGYYYSILIPKRLRWKSRWQQHAIETSKRRRGRTQEKLQTMIVLTISVWWSLIWAFWRPILNVHSRMMRYGWRIRLTMFIQYSLKDGAKKKIIIICNIFVNIGEKKRGEWISYEQHFFKGHWWILYFNPDHDDLIPNAVPHATPIHHVHQPKYVCVLVRIQSYPILYVRTYTMNTRYIYLYEMLLFVATSDNNKRTLQTAAESDDRKVF